MSNPATSSAPQALRVTPSYSIPFEVVTFDIFYLVVHKVMDRLKLFRLTTFLYFVEQFAVAEGSTEAVRREIWSILEKSPGTKVLAERFVQMDSMQRLISIANFLNLLKTFDSGNRKIDQQDWVARVNRIFEHSEGPASSVYELLAVKRPGGGELDYLSTVLKGCSLVSLDELFISAGIQILYQEQIKNDAVKSGKFWRVKCPYRGIELFVSYQAAAKICRTYGQSPALQGIVEWLEKEPPGPSNDAADRQRGRILEAVDSTKYIITLLGIYPGRGYLVLIDASNAELHTASFMKACVGLPLHEFDVWDDQCGRLTDLLEGPVHLNLDDSQMGELTILTSQQDPRGSFVPLTGEYDPSMQ